LIFHYVSREGSELQVIVPQVDIPHRHADLLVTGEGLNSPEVRSQLDQPRAERVAAIVKAKVCDARVRAGLPELVVERPSVDSEDARVAGLSWDALQFFHR